METPQPVTSAAARRIEPRARPAFARRSSLSIVAFVLALLPVLSWGSCTSGLVQDPIVGLLVWLLCAALSLLGAIIGFVNAFRLSRIRRSRHAEIDRPFGLGMSLLAGIIGVLAPVLTFLAGWHENDLP